jgi:Uncharacterized protein conserved in bacteria
VNKSKKYVLLYIDEADLDKTLRDLGKLKFVTDIVLSEYPNIKREYHTEDKEKEDYRLI